MIELLMLAAALVPQVEAVKQDDDPKPVTVRLRRGEKLSGTIEKIAADGTLTLRQGEEGTTEILLEDLEAVEIGSSSSSTAKKTLHRMDFVATGRNAMLRRGGHLMGELESYRDGVFSFKTILGTLSVPRDRVRRVRFAGRKAAVEEGTGDAVVTAGSTTRGTLESIDADHVTVKTAEGTEKIPRKDARLLVLDEGEPIEASTRGLYVKIELINGGGVLPGVLGGTNGGAITLFCPHFGEVAIPLASVRRFSTQDRLSFQAGRVLLCDYNQISEFDISGTSRSGKPRSKRIWTYQEPRIQYSSSVRKLPDGNVIVTDMNTGVILEVQPKDASRGGTVVFEGSASQPVDVCKLGPGRYMVAERSTKKLVELDKEGERVREIDIPGGGRPLRLISLSNGNLIILTDKRTILEMTLDEELVRTIKVKGGTPTSMELLENGNFLLISQSNRMVWEVTPDGKKIWEKKNLSRPVGAARLDNGNTLIAEQGKNRLTEYDTAGNAVRTVPLTGLRTGYYQSLTYY